MTGMLEKTFCDYLHVCELKEKYKDIIFDYQVAVEAFNKIPIEDRKALQLSLAEIHLDFWNEHPVK